MRITVKKQLRRYLFLSWVVAMLAMVIAVKITHGTAQHEDWEAIILTGAILAGFMLTLIDVWCKEEQVLEKKRNKPLRGVRSRRT